jgi:hypothetical protein
MDAQPPKPPDEHCVVCGETLEWEWDDDGPVPSDPPGYVPQPHWTPSSLIWGKAPHCSRRCYLKGDEYRQRQEATANVDA